MSSHNIKPFLTKSEQIMIENVPDMILCKPRLVPLKSFTLEKLEKMQQQAQKSNNQDDSPKNE